MCAEEMWRVIVVLLTIIVIGASAVLKGCLREGMYASASGARHQPAWEASIGPWVPLSEPGDPRYFDDGGWSDAAWKDALDSVVTREGVGGEERANLPELELSRRKQVPDIGVRMALEDIAAKLDPLTATQDPRGLRPVRWSVKESEQVSDRVWHAQVLACFHEFGRARGWCASMRLRLDLSAAHSDGWRYAVQAATMAGTVPEASIMLLPRVGDGALIT